MEAEPAIGESAEEEGGMTRHVSQEQLKRAAERLIKAGKMPTIEELTAVVLKMRMKYALRIRRARREEKWQLALDLEDARQRDRDLESIEEEK